MAKGILGKMKGGFRLGSSPKLQKRFISRKTLGARKGAAGFKKFMGASNKTKGRFLRSKVKGLDKNVRFAKKFFKSDTKTKKRWMRRKANLLKRKASEKALEGGRAVLKAVKNSVMAKGFNPLKFILMVFAGWLVNQLPKIIEGIKKFIEWAKPAFEILGNIMKGIVKFMKWIGGGLAKLWNGLTGNTDEIENAKKQIESKNKELKGAFKKQEKGFNELTNKAKGEEKVLRKDMDDLKKEVDKELGEDGAETNNEDKATPKSTIQYNESTGKYENISNTAKSTPKNKLTSTSSSRRIGTGKPITVEIKGQKTILQPGTIEYYNFFKPGGTSSKIYHGKVKDVNLVKTPSGPKIVTVDYPVPSKVDLSGKMGQPGSGETFGGRGGSTYNQGSSDGVNSKKAMLTAIDS